MPPDIIRTEPALELRGISKYFGDLAALRGVTLRIVRGESVLIYGPNGAGKTTLLRTLASLAQPTEGEGRIRFACHVPLQRSDGSGESGARGQAVRPPGRGEESREGA